MKENEMVSKRVFPKKKSIKRKNAKELIRKR